MLTVFDPAFRRSERTALSRQTFGSVRIAQKDQKSIRINPTQRHLLAQDLRGPPLRSFARPKLLERASVYAGVQAYPLFTMSRNPPRSRADGKGALSAWMDVILLSGGANRDRTDDLKLAKLALSQLSYGPKPDGAYHISGKQSTDGPTRGRGGPGKI
jgi:hypothetical protein